MIFARLRELREKFYAVQKLLPVDSPESLALAEAIDDLDDHLVMEARATYAATGHGIADYNGEQR